MSDEVAKQFESKANPTEQSGPPRSATLTVTLHPDGGMEFSFPPNEILSYGMLEKARAKLDELALVRQAQRTQRSSGGMGGLLKRINGR